MPWSVAPNSARAAYVSRALAGVGSYEKIDVLGKAGLRMQDDGVAFDNEVLNAMGMEGGQKVFVVLVHPAAPSTL